MKNALVLYWILCNKVFGQALDFVWSGTGTGDYCIRESITSRNPIQFDQLLHLRRDCLVATVLESRVVMDPSYSMTGIVDCSFVKLMLTQKKCTGRKMCARLTASRMQECPSAWNKTEM